MRGWGEVVGGFAIAIALVVGFHAHMEREAMTRFHGRVIVQRIEVECELREENARLRAELDEVRTNANEINEAVRWLGQEAIRRGRFPELPLLMLPLWL